MTILRRCHPYHGEALDVLGWTHRRGTLHLVLVLPDGTRSLIPASWTDLHHERPSTPGTPDEHVAGSVPPAPGSVGQLLHTRIVVDALLHRLATAPREDPPSPREEEGNVHVQLSFLEERRENGAVWSTVWSTLDTAQRAAAVATLARLIAKLAVAAPAPTAKATVDE